MKPRQNFLLKETNKIFISKIKSVIDAKESYGYRRVTAVLNRTLVEQGEKSVNHKRIYRLMKQEGLLLTSPKRKPTRLHEGRIITLHSNLRWCSDTFSIQCDNGDRVFVAFTLDTCDREVIAYVVSTVGIDGAAIRDLMVESVEKRFGKVGHLPHPVQWLSDNGPCYVARETVLFARTLGFEVCTTPAYSPESNGMAEALVKTLRRDYIAFSDLRNALIVMQQVPNWFYLYNEVAPHKGLKMLSPRQFLKAVKGA